MDGRRSFLRSESIDKLLDYVQVVEDIETLLDEAGQSGKPLSTSRVRETIRTRLGVN